MGLEFLFLLSAAVVLPAVTGAFAFAFWRRARVHDGVAAAWSSYAARRAFRYESPAGAWPNTSSPAVTGDAEGCAFRLDLLGTHGDVRTLLTLRIEPPRLGEAVLDAAGVVRAEKPAGFGAAIARDEVVRALRAFALDDATELRHVRGAFELEWPGGESSDARLDEARNLAILAAWAVTARERRSGT